MGTKLLGRFNCQNPRRIRGWFDHQNIVETGTIARDREKGTEVSRDKRGPRHTVKQNGDRS